MVKKGFALSLALLLVVAQVQIVEAKLDCGPTTNKSIQLPRTIAIGTNPAGTGAHAIASALAAIASKTTQVSAKVQPYNGPNAWMPLLESGEIEFGIINILDSNMAATGTGNYKKAHPGIRVVAGGVFPFTAGLIVRDKSDIKQMSDLKGKRMAWDYGGHAINQTWQNGGDGSERFETYRRAASAGVELERRCARRAGRKSRRGVHGGRDRCRRRGQRHGAGALHEHAEHTGGE